MELGGLLDLNQCRAACAEAKYATLNDQTIRCRIMVKNRKITMLRQGVLAGAAGGLAEVAWVSLYAAATGGDAAILAHGVTTAGGVTALLPASPVALGAAVHMTLAVMLGVALSGVWAALRRGSPRLSNPYPFMLAALAGVWAINFFVVLPIVSPAFVHIVPYAVSLTSKLLFGVAAATVLQRQTVVELLTSPIQGRK
jgi:hypothetical protein